METIELSPLDKKDLLELLEYAKKWQLSGKKAAKNSIENWDDTKWWLMRIEQLEMLIKGRNVQNSYIQSTYETIDYEMNLRDKNKLRYRKSLEEDIIDVFDSKKETKNRDNLF